MILNYIYYNDCEVIFSKYDDKLDALKMIIYIGRSDTIYDFDELSKLINNVCKEKGKQEDVILYSSDENKIILKNFEDDITNIFNELTLRGAMLCLNSLVIEKSYKTYTDSQKDKVLANVKKKEL